MMQNQDFSISDVTFLRQVEHFKLCIGLNVSVELVVKYQIFGLDRGASNSMINLQQCGRDSAFK